MRMRLRIRLLTSIGAPVVLVLGLVLLKPTEMTAQTKLFRFGAGPRR